MTWRRGEEPGGLGAHGFGGFLRSLLAGVPWSERAEREETLSLESPSSGRFRVHNANGQPISGFLVLTLELGGREVDRTTLELEIPANSVKTYDHTFSGRTPAFGTPRVTAAWSSLR